MLLRRLIAVLSVLAAVLIPDPALAVPPATYRVDGIDVASWQHPGGAAIDWRQVHAAGVEFATIKATEGSLADRTEYTNPYFRGDITAARNAGLAVAPYHFYLGRNPNTGGAQADYFIAAVRACGYTGSRPGDLPPILDYEWDWKGGCPPYGTVADVPAWLTKVRAAFGRTPLVYTSRAFVAGCLGGTAEVAAGGNQLQVAYYGTATSPSLPAGWRHWLMWQWTASSCVGGVPTCRLTRSVFNGDQSLLAGLSNRR